MLARARWMQELTNRAAVVATNRTSMVISGDSSGTCLFRGALTEEEGAVGAVGGVSMWAQVSHRFGRACP
jgi:hypothetical protein